jgi:prepilin-type N-terminal cleavage/methylation domain-containing protein
MLGAFTLIELLVVVCVIALLVASLLPTVGMITQTDSHTKCLSNQRNLAAAMLGYTGDNGGRVRSFRLAPRLGSM